MTGSAQFTPPTLRAALEAARYVEGDRFEVAAKKAGGRGMLAHWGDVSPAGLEAAARWLNARGGRDCYFLANPLIPGAPRPRAGRAGNAHVASRRVLLLDVDPCSVTRRAMTRKKNPHPGPHDEHGTAPHKLQAAEEIAVDLRAFLFDRLGVLTPYVSSGRGRQLWLWIDGEHEDPLRRDLVRALADRFDRAGAATLDVNVWNPARLMRLPGGVNSKTGETARVLDLGNGKAATVEQLQELADELAPEPTATPSRPTSRTYDPDRFADLDPAQEGARVAEALSYVDSGDRDVWIRVGMALHRAGIPGGRELWDAWSASGEGYEGSGDVAYHWSSFDRLGGSERPVTLRSVYRWATEGGWIPSTPRASTRERELPLARVCATPRQITAPDQVSRFVASVLRPPPKKRGQRRERKVVQDRRPTGAGKTTTAARELANAARDDVGGYAWAAPSHQAAARDALPALARAGAAVWDLDLAKRYVEGEPTARETLDAMGAVVVPVGQEVEGRATAVKLPPFACPGPDPDSLPLKAEKVNEAYATAASRGWNPATTVCGACARFYPGSHDECPYWSQRRLALKADVVVGQHHGMAGALTEGRVGLVVDEDPSGALVKTYSVTPRKIRAFLQLLEAGIEQLEEEHGGQIDAARDVYRDAAAHGDADLRAPQALRKLHEVEDLAGDELEVATSAHDAARVALEAVRQLVALWAELGQHTPPVSPLPRPDVDLRGIDAGAQLVAEASERAMRYLLRKGRKLEPPNDGRGPLGPICNLWPFLGELARVWATGKPALVHSGREGRGRASGWCAKLPVVRQLPDVSVLALDATGDGRLLELATGLEVEHIEGELTGRLEGVHLADAPTGRGRLRKGKAAEADLEAVGEWCRRVGAARVGLLTFSRLEKDAGRRSWVERVERALAKAGVEEVRALHYGAERGSNAFSGWADAVVVLGTPYVDVGSVRLRAHLEGAELDELLKPLRFVERRLPGGGLARVLEAPGEASARAYAALTHASLEQALGRALRGEWSPPLGVLVVAEPWPTRHRLRVSTRAKEWLGRPHVAATCELRRLAHGAEAPPWARVLTTQDARKRMQAAAAAGEMAQAAAACLELFGRVSRDGGIETPERVAVAFLEGAVAGLGGAEVASGYVGVEKRALCALREVRPSLPQVMARVALACIAREHVGFQAVDSAALTCETSSGAAPSCTYRSSYSTYILEGLRHVHELVERGAKMAGGTRKLDRLLGVSAGVCSSWRSGRKRPSLESASRLVAFVEGLSTPPIVQWSDTG